MGKRKATGRFSQGLVAAAKDVWSVAGANTAMQNIMGMGAGVSTEDVCTLRHDTLGTGIELWHGSFGWFDFMAHDGAPVILSDTWGIQVERPTQVCLTCDSFALSARSEREPPASSIVRTSEA